MHNKFYFSFVLLQLNFYLFLNLIIMFNLDLIHYFLLYFLLYHLNWWNKLKKFDLYLHFLSYLILNHCLKNVKYSQFLNNIFNKYLFSVFKKICLHDSKNLLY